jgi:hypothetical protein
MRLHLVALIVFILIQFQQLINPAKAQDFQWGVRSKTTDKTIFFATDSANVFNNIYNARQFLYDSLTRVAIENKTQFQERVYVYDFQPVTKVHQLIISFPDAARYIYYIKAFDQQGNEHIVYEYSARSHCKETYEWLIITVPPISYTITSIEVGTFQKIKTVERIGTSQLENINDLLAQLMRNGLAESYCSITSFIADRERLSPINVNSDKSEVKPIVSADGSRLYFHRQNFKENIGGSSDDQDIYVTENKANQWSKALNLGSPVNNKSSNGIASIMPGENGAYLINEYKNNKIGGQGVSFSKKELKGWSMPEKVLIEDFSNNSPYFDFCISTSMGEMILAIDKGDGLGDQDLYISRYNDDSSKWSAPVNLGEVVNTPLAETSPYLAADGKTLYFASEGHLGYGGFDLFITKRLDNTWTNWSQPENLGSIINSDEHDLYYSVSALADYAYFSSGPDDNRDLYRIPLPKVYKPAPVTIIQGYALKADSTIVTATIRVLNKKGTWLTSAKSSDVDGFYRAIIPIDSSCIIQLVKQGQLLLSDTLSTLGYSGKKIVIKNFVLPNDALNTLSSLAEEDMSTPFQDPASTGLTKVINGKVVDGASLRPVGTRLLYYNDGSVISRALSSPETGDYQVILTDAFPDSIRTIDPTIGSFTTLPDHTAFNDHILIQLPNGKSDTVRLGTRIYKGLSSEEIRKMQRSFTKRRTIKRYYYRMVKTRNIHPALLDDLTYAATLLEKSKKRKLTIIITCESDYKNADTYRKMAGELIINALKASGVSETKVDLIHAAPFEDKSNLKNRLNTGVWLQLSDMN